MTGDESKETMLRGEEYAFSQCVFKKITNGSEITWRFNI